MTQIAKKQTPPELIFIRAFIQVFLVSINTYFIAKGLVIGIFSAAWLISYVWSLNVTKFSNPTHNERLIYSSGAAFGAVAGYFAGHFIHTL